MAKFDAVASSSVPGLNQVLTRVFGGRLENQVLFSLTENPVLKPHVTDEMLARAREIAGVGPQGAVYTYVCDVYPKRDTSKEV